MSCMTTVTRTTLPTEGDAGTGASTCEGQGYPQCTSFCASDGISASRRQRSCKHSVHLGALPSIPSTPLFQPRRQRHCRTSRDDRPARGSNNRDHAHITSSALHTAPAGPALTDVSPCSSFPLSWPFSAGLVADASNDCATAMIVSTCSVLRPVWIRCCWNMSPPCQIIGCDIARLREALAELSVTVSEPEK